MMRRFVKLDDIQWCPIHHGYLNQDSRQCDSYWWIPSESEKDCQPVAVYIKRKGARS